MDYELSYDQLLDQLIEMKKEETQRIWDQGSLCLILIERMKVKPGDIASNIGCSAQYVRDMARTFAAFPEDRSQELSFSHHKISAKTDNPMYWLEQAEANQWSAKQLQEAIAGKPETTALSKVQKLYEKVVKVLEDGGPEADWLSEQLWGLGLKK